MVEEKEQCQQVIYDDRGPDWLCTKKAIVERDGKFYCKIHDPEYIKEKHRKWQEKFDKEFAENTIRDHRKSVIRKVCEPFTTEWLEANAFVLKASKDMYEALQAIEYIIGVDKSELSNHPVTVQMVKEALAQVEGKQ